MPFSRRGRGGGCLDSMDGGGREEQHDVGKDFSCMFGFHVSIPNSIMYYVSE